MDRGAYGLPSMGSQSGTTEQQTLSALVVINLCECVCVFFFLSQ